jgi:hypothetical protein
VAPAAQKSAFVAVTRLVGLMALGRLRVTAEGSALVRGAVHMTVWGAFAMAATAAVGWVFRVAA